MLALQLYLSAWRHGLRVAISFVLIFLALVVFAALIGGLPLYLAATAAPGLTGLFVAAVTALAVGLIGPLALGFATQPDSASAAADLGPDREMAAIDAVLERF